LSGYYRAFNVKKIDSSGFVVDLAGEILNVQNITTSSSLGTLQSDNDSNIAGGSFSASAGDIVEFSSGSYPGVFRQILAATLADAYSDPRNNWMSFVAEDLSTAATLKAVDIYVGDATNTAIKREFLGNAKPMTIAQISYQSSVAKTARIFVVGKDTNNKFSQHNLDLADFQDVGIPALGGGSSFEALSEHYADRTTSGTTTETLWTDSLAAGKLAVNGDRLEAQYSGIFAANGNSKSLTVNFAGTDIFATGGLTENATHWWINISITRVNSTTVRCAVEAMTGVHFTPVYTEITGLTLSNAYDLLLKARTITAAGDLTAKKGWLEFRASAYQTAVTYLGETVTYNGNVVTYG
jgi:hypothetical protein